ncbi:PREDICTED: RNA polymerase II degradation factor 1-like [Papilio xuthus]|uniref:RNA polymerase II degradation factor 1-like n=1 Tax=Papilio xuthus TaxID=66420 RepID=A0AAJ6ZIG8_PAPXU
MRLYALILVLAASRAGALPLDSAPAHGAQPAQVAPLEDADAEKLRNVPDVIPVAIVEDTVVPAKIDENSNDYIPSDDKPSPIIKRLEIDLSNPGPPQRQQHETQNPESYIERNWFVADIKQKLLDTENVFKKSVSNVNEGFQNWVSNSAHLKTVQSDIKDMQSKFIAQLDKLQQSVQSYLNPQSAKAVIVDPEAAANLKEVESRLIVLKNNFEVGVQTLSEGVKVLEAKADGDASAAANPTGTGATSPNPPAEQSSNNPLGQVFQFFSNTMGQAITQMQNTFNSLTNPSNQNGGSDTGSQPSWNPLPGLFNQQSSTAAPAGTQADEATTRPPSAWDNFQQQLSQFFGSESNPFNQANQFIQNIINQVRPSSATPTDTNTKPENDPVQQNNAPVPSKPISPPPAQVQPAAAAQPQPEPVQPQAPEPAKESQATSQPGPIRQIIQNNPIVKGVVQRIQSFSNPEKPRDKPEIESEPAKPEKALEPENIEDAIKEETVPEAIKEEAASEVIKEEVVPEIIKEEAVPATKGHGGGINSVNSGDNNDSDGIAAKKIALDEKIEEVPHKCQMEKKQELASDKEEKETALLPDKTE